MRNSCPNEKRRPFVEDYAKSLLLRIQHCGHVIKTWAYLDPEFVLKQARQLDAIPPKQRGPLHGINIGITDVIPTKDVPTTHNSPISRNDPPGSVDTGCVVTLRASGALISGETTTTESASTVVGGPSAHDPTRTPGGSSSRSGAAVPIALGTQAGGSTIRPGSFN